MKKKPRVVIDKRFTIVHHKLQIVLHGFQTEDIHEFRTEIKKLKAFLKLFRTKKRHSGTLKITKKLNRIYKHLGYLRVIQLQEQNIRTIVKDMEIETPATCHIIRAMERALLIKTGNLIRNNKSIKKDKACIVRNIPGKFSKRSIVQFAHRVSDILKRMVSRVEIDDESMHYIRKRMKDLQYNWPYIKQIMHNGSIAWLLKKNKIRVITDLIGDFHDSCVMLDLLYQQLTLFALGMDERMILMNVWNKWHTHKEILRQKIYSAITKPA